MRDPESGERVSPTRAEALHAFLPKARRGRRPPSRSDRIDERTIDIANRLRFVCAALTSEELLALARRMATLELAYSERECKAAS
jgi:hypothetical protein